MSVPKRPGPNPAARTLTREEALAAELAYDPQQIPLRMGASIPVILIRREYETTDDKEKGLAAALKLGRDIFEAGTITDEQLTKIAKGEATLRGFTDTGITYHDRPCTLCMEFEEDDHLKIKHRRGCDGFYPRLPYPKAANFGGHP